MAKERVEADPASTPTEDDTTLANADAAVEEAAEPVPGGTVAPPSPPETEGGNPFKPSS